MRNHGSSCRLLPQPGVGLGEHLADLGVVEELVDLFESSPLEPLAMGVCDVLLRAGGMDGITDLGEVVDDGLDDLTPPADVGVGQAALKAVQERPIDDARLFLELAGGRLTARLALFDTTFGEFPLVRGLRTVAEWRTRYKSPRSPSLRNGMTPADRS